MHTQRLYPSLQWNSRHDCTDKTINSYWRNRGRNRRSRDTVGHAQVSQLFSDSNSLPSVVHTQGLHTHTWYLVLQANLQVLAKTASACIIVRDSKCIVSYYYYLFTLWDCLASIFILVDFSLAITGVASCNMEAMYRFTTKVLQLLNCSSSAAIAMATATCSYYINGMVVTKQSFTDHNSFMDDKAKTRLQHAYKDTYTRLVTHTWKLPWEIVVRHNRRIIRMDS